MRHVAYGLTASKLKSTMPGGKTIEVDGKAGHAMEGPAGLHSPENVGTSEVHVIVFEVKEPATRWVGLLKRFVSSKGVMVKATSGIYTFGRGLPDEEVHYLFAVVRKVLARVISGR